MSDDRQRFKIADNEAKALKQIDSDMIKLNNDINHLSRLYNGQKLQKVNLLRNMVTNAGMTGDYEHTERYDYMYPLEPDQEPTPFKVKEEGTKAKVSKMTVKKSGKKVSEKKLVPEITKK